LRGLQTGVATIPVLVGQSVDVSGETFARRQLIKRFSAFGWPVAVDLSARRVYGHEGRVYLGGLYAGWMRERISAALPDPQA
jgi:hypothetical protein